MRGLAKLTDAVPVVSKRTTATLIAMLLCVVDVMTYVRGDLSLREF